MQTYPQPPLAQTISPEARAALTPFLAAAEQPQPPLTIAQMREIPKMLLPPIVKARSARYDVAVKPGSLGGVPVQMVSRSDSTSSHGGKLLINFHGGGFMVDSGSLTETIPIAGLTGLPVAAVLYRLAPEHPYPAAVDDALAAYKAALATHRPSDVAIFGTSAGAILCAQLVARLKRDGLPLPVGVGFFSGSADLAHGGDSEGFLPTLLPGKPLTEVIAPYIGSANRTDPLVSPLFGQLERMPPTLLMSSTRDVLLSQTVRYHLALRAAGNDADLFVYEGMPHAFWGYADCPETDAAFKVQADFLAKTVRAAD